MNETPKRTSPGWAYGLAVVGAFLIVALLVLTMRRYAQPEPLDAARAAERAKALAELRGAEVQALHSVAWVDQGKGVVRLRIEDAMEIVQNSWAKDPAAGRSNLLARTAKAFAVPPKAPEKPSQFE
jgi:uncharacterized protein YdaU (DUF1376 family)